MIIPGDCLDVMATMDENSIDAIVTDPPYGLSFMNKEWDHGVPGEHFWVEALRIAKPGSYLLAFGGTRTYHRLTCAIEDAGWEIRDCIGWIYGSGFPKSLDVSKAIDKEAGMEREIIGQYSRQGRSGGILGKHTEIIRDISVASTEAAKQWTGWGTALKPAWEPVIMARKPLTGTVASTVQEWGTGGINIDGCRVGTDEKLSFGSRKLGDGIKYGILNPTTEGIQNPNGRWPANIIHDGSDEVLAIFPETKSGGGNKRSNDPGMWSGKRPFDYLCNTSEGSASRFFYCAKASPSERGKINKHPTVKPLALMKYLCRLVTPPGGTVLDPFAGSGSTLIAAREEGFNAIGIELNPDYVEIAESRLKTPYTAKLVASGW